MRTTPPKKANNSEKTLPEPIISYPTSDGKTIFTVMTAEQFKESPTYIKMSDDEKKKFAFVGKENEKADTVVLRTNAEDKENGLEHIHIGSRMKASPGTAKIDINYNYNAKTGHISDYGFSIKGAALRVNYGENENDRPVILGSTERVDVPKEPAGNGTERKDIKSQDLLRDDVDRKLATHELASAGLSKEVMAQALAAVDKNLPALGAPMNISSKSSLGIG